MLRSRGVRGWVGAAVLWTAVSCASTFTNVEDSDRGGHSSLGGAGMSAGRSGAAAGMRATAGTGTQGGQGAGGSAGGELAGEAGSAGAPVTSSGGTTSSGGRSMTGGSGATAGTAGEAGDTTQGSGGSGGRAGSAGQAGSGGSPPADPIHRDGLVYWFSADSGVTQTNGGVSKWLDRSGNGNDAAQISSDSRPRLGTFADTGAPALVFDGDNDYLGLTPLRTNFDAGVTFFAVARPTDGSYCMPLLELSNGPEMDDVSFGWTKTALSYEVFEDFVSGQDGAFTLGEPRLVDITHAASGNVNLWMNGLADGLTLFDLPAAVTRGQTFVGKSLYAGCSTWNGEIAEIILYARELDLSERQDVESYLAGKWGCCGN